MSRKEKEIMSQMPDEAATEKFNRPAYPKVSVYKYLRMVKSKARRSAK
ncbi:hypothetical protein M2145_002565 [Lachnospiraceae bacterium PF1-21]